MKISCMQPYYYPYAGYFRLFTATDLFVILDDVQWNRRGRVHRYQSKGKWKTLPIKKTPRDTTRIMDMKWQDGQEKTLSPIVWIISSMGYICSQLGLPFNVIRSNELNIRTKGQQRIIDICKKVGATEYINLPGGKELYNEDDFSKKGIKLTFLPEYHGSYDSIIERLIVEDPAEIRREIYDNL